MALSDWISNPPNPATPATDATDKPQTRPTVASVASVAASPKSDAGLGYTVEDLAVFDKLLRELAELESWSEGGLADALDQRRRMAPVRVPGALAEIRKAHGEALGQWPNTATRTEVKLLEGWL